MRIRSEEDLINTMIDNFRLKDKVSTYEGTLTHTIFAAVAYLIHEESVEREYEEDKFFLRKGIFDELDDITEQFGYKRKEGVKASGFVTFMGSENQEIPEELIIRANGLEFEVLEPGKCTKDEDGDFVATLKIACTKVGYEGNVKAGTDFVCSDMNFDRIYNQNAFKGGIDIESDRDYYDRFIYTQHNRGTSGNEQHYRQWGLEVDGVRGVNVKPLWKGNGTVKVLIMGEQGKSVDDDVVKHAREYIETKRPVGASVTTESIKTKLLNISAKIKINNATSVEAIEHRFKEEANEKLLLIKDKVYISKLSSILGLIQEIDYFTDFKVNNLNSDLSLSDEEIAQINEVKFEVISDV